MTDAIILDGIAAAAELKERIQQRATTFIDQTGHKPGLAVVIVGHDPASQVYVRSKLKLAKNLGFHSVEHRLTTETSEQALLDLVQSLNESLDIHGILVQLPLPDHMNVDAILAAIDPQKDVDGFHVVNAGQLVIGKPSFVPCTPLGCLHLIKQAGLSLPGLHAVVIGRSNIVGKPVAQLLLAQDCTVTLAHSKTKNMQDLTRQADILVAAVGRPQMVQDTWIKPGATVIDVGINRITRADGTSKLVGDVDYDSAKRVASAITPVPGGVGPMTVAYLMANTCQAAYFLRKMEWSDLV